MSTNIDKINDLVTETKANSDTLETIKYNLDGTPRKKRGRKPKNMTNQNKTTNKEKKQKKRGRKTDNKFNVEENLEEYENIIQNENNIIKIPINSVIDEENKSHNLFDINYYVESNTEIIHNFQYKIDVCSLSFNKFDEFEKSTNIALYEYLYKQGDITNKNKYITILKNIIKKLEQLSDNEIINYLNNKNRVSNTLSNQNIQQSQNKYNYTPNISKNNTISSNLQNLNNQNVDTMADADIYYIQKRNELLKDLNNDNLKQIEILIKKKYHHTKQVSLLNKFCVDIKTNNIWPNKTNIKCLWCCHNFDNTPWGTPTKYENGKFTLKNIFCSPNCGMSHILHNEKNENVLYEQIALLNFLYHTIYECDDNIVPAPDKMSLQEFGGPLTISEFRYLTLNNKKIYDIKYPPCDITAPILEETKKLTDQANFFIPIDYNKINKINDELKIRRRNPKKKGNIFSFIKNANNNSNNPTNNTNNNTEDNFIN